MTTLIDSLAAAKHDRQAHADYVAEQLAPEKVRAAALAALKGRLAPGTLRTGLVAACPDLAPVWHAWADEMDALTAGGFDPEVFAKEIETALGGDR